MSERSICRCSLCFIEEKLRAEIAAPGNHERVSELLRSGLHLARFRNVEELLSHLHSLNGNSASDPFLAELLETRPRFPGSLVASVFILLFLPVLHATVRRVRHRYPALAREDVAQQTVEALLAYLASIPFAARESYLAFAMARRIRRATFEWAAREARSPLASLSVDPYEPLGFESAGESFERAALLRHLFGRAVERGTLTSGELDLLVQFKLEGGADNGAFSNAERQRLKRLLGKVRKLVCP